MPLWKIFHSPGLLTASEERRSIAEAATKFYVSIGLPDFYVNVHFYPVPPAQFYTAGKEVTQTIGLEILHVARNWDPSDIAKATRFKDVVDQIMRPYTMDRGVHLEYCVLEGPAALWRINGIDPPEAFGPDDHVEAETNRKRLLEYHHSRQ